jgi:flagellar basal-body rod protein FlgC
MFDKMFESMQISASALSAERRRMNVIANNLSNINTTRGPDGGPYRRKYVVFETLLKDAASMEEPGPRERGVRVSEVEKDARPFRRIYKPGHPDADAEGYVSMPNVDMVEESVDLLSASRAYGANLMVLKTAKDMIRKMIELLTRT